MDNNLINTITSSATIKKDRIEYWKNEINLDDSFIPHKNNQPNNINNNNNNSDEKRVFLSGATGFLGAYLLAHLLKLPNCTIVYCLLRNKKKLGNPIDDILNNLKQHKLYDQITPNQLLKIEVVGGDLRKPKFGISIFDYSDLANDINLIINSAANINLQLNYEKMKTINVNGIREMIKLSISVQPPIKMVFISSFSVFNNHILKEGERFDEQIQLPLIDNLEKESCGYIQSKIVSEYLLMNASNKFNIPAMIIRSPVLFINPYTSIGAHDLFQTLFLSSHEIGFYPTLDINVLVSPITWASENIIKVILNENCWKSSKSPLSKTTSIYNINGEIQRFDILFDATLKKQFGCKEMPFYEWCNKVYNSNLVACKRYCQLRTNDFLMLFKIDKSLGVSKNTKSLLQSLGSYGGNHFDLNSSGVNEEMILSSISYNNKKTSSKL
ncbi:hypothetical protein RB653_003200 [Dictyostelium firmibasis]|uniref:Thioester reductase (TE) domain-containing protein n=1 Tax=Dictyostelium firmibasis TaxID=79012 RepID=A0AAN7TYV4_9MYCE